MPPNPPLSILLIGRDDLPELSSTAAVLEAALEKEFARLVHEPHLDAAANRLDSGELCPELILVVQSRPGEHDATQIERLRRAAPLARMLALVGPWCEGEVRSGTPWPGVPRWYWQQAAPRLRQEFERWQSGQPLHSSLPSTANEEERLLLACQTPLVPRQGLVALAGQNLHVVEMLAAACRQRGYAAVMVDAVPALRLREVAFALWESSTADAESLRHLSHLAAAVQPAPTLAVLGFPRRHDIAAALAAGAADVISKPLNLDDLFAAAP